MSRTSIPVYAGGYGVGQLLPSAYSYYNVPMQYRSMYYDTPRLRLLVRAGRDLPI